MSSHVIVKPEIARFAQILTANRCPSAKDQNGAAISGALVAATWTLPNGSAQTQTATTNSSGSAIFSTKSGRGIYTLRVTNITKAGGTFDKANSVLTKSITK
jgi:hypothetical protein